MIKLMIVGVALAIGAATAQQMMADDVARMKVVISGSTNEDSVNSR